MSLTVTWLQQEAALSMTLSMLWEQSHGSPAGNVRTLVGLNSVALCLEDAFSPAEREVTRRAESLPLFQRYAEQLLATVLPDLKVQVEIITGCHVVSGSVRPDAETGQLVCFFILGEQRRLTPPSGVESLPWGRRKLVAMITYWLRNTVSGELVNVTLIVIYCLVALRRLFLRITRNLRHTNEVLQHVRPSI